MSKDIRIKKGLNIPLKGEAEKIMKEATCPEYIAIKPTDFIGVVPKVITKEGTEVKVGTPLFFDKNQPDVQFTSPVSGILHEIKRGDKRKILEFIVKVGKEQIYEDFGNVDVNSGRESIINNLLKSGLWPFLRQRPYGTIANPKQKPKAIFISAHNTAPLAPDNDFIMHGQGDCFQIGLDILSKLTEGKVHLNIKKTDGVSKVFSNSKNVQINTFSGPHPSGNVGVQIHHIDPINKGETVWYLYPQDVLTIGRFFKTRKIDAGRIVAITGSEIEKPAYYKTIIGTSINHILQEVNINQNARVISGNVLTGTQIEENGFLGFYDSQITAIKEGNYFDFLGWALPGLKKYSLSRTFFSWLMPNKKQVLDTNYHGGERAFVFTGIYEKYLPMDILPMQLLKAIIVKDIDLMEKLGIYEVVEEDFALSEFACPSKIELQAIIRDGLNFMKNEME